MDESSIICIIIKCSDAFKDDVYRKFTWDCSEKGCHYIDLSNGFVDPIESELGDYFVSIPAILENKIKYVRRVIVQILTTLHVNKSYCFFQCYSTSEMSMMFRKKYPDNIDKHIPLISALNNIEIFVTFIKQPHSKNKP